MIRVEICRIFNKKLRLKAQKFNYLSIFPVNFSIKSTRTCINQKNPFRKWPFQTDGDMKRLRINSSKSTQISILCPNFHCVLFDSLFCANYIERKTCFLHNHAVSEKKIFQWQRFCSEWGNLILGQWVGVIQKRNY